VSEEEEGFAGVATAALNTLLLGLETRLDACLGSLMRHNWAATESVGFCRRWAAQHLIGLNQGCCCPPPCCQRQMRLTLIHILIVLAVRPPTCSHAANPCRQGSRYGRCKRLEARPTSCKHSDG
jgi:hypothetical protein